MSKIKDNYPNETKSLNALPYNSPLKVLPYGGVLTIISIIVQKYVVKKEDYD